MLTTLVLLGALASSESQSGFLRLSSVETVKINATGTATVRIARDKLRDAAVGTGGLLQLDLTEVTDASNPMTLQVCAIVCVHVLAHDCSN